MQHQCSAHLSGVNVETHLGPWKHGSKPKRLYVCWMHIRSRCFCTTSKDYQYYGGRGITVCDEWNQYIPFRDWAFSNGWRDDLEIDRIDVNGNYEPGNCRWVDGFVQARNRRDNRLLTINGVSRCVSEWAAIAGVPPDRILVRLDKLGWSAEAAVNVPKKTPRDQVDVVQLTVNGITKPLIEWSRLCGIVRNTLAYRLKRGWSPERAVTEPVRRHN